MRSNYRNVEFVIIYAMIRYYCKTRDLIAIVLSRCFLIEGKCDLFLIGELTMSPATFENVRVLQILDLVEFLYSHKIHTFSK